MATYRYLLEPVPNTNPQEFAASLKLTDRPIYGSSRIGSHTQEMELYGAPNILTYPYTQPMPAVKKRYELTDHLGNVAAVVTGRLLPGNNTGSPYQAELVSAQGYEPGGSLLPDRNYSSDSYRWGFNGKPKDDEIHGATGTSYDFGARLYDPRVGRWLSLDPKAAKFPFASPYSFALDNPIYFVNPDGQVIKPFGNALGLMDFRRYVKDQIGRTSVGDYLQHALAERKIGTGQSTGIEYRGFGLSPDASQDEFNKIVKKAVKSGEITAKQARAAKAIFGALGDKEVIEVGVWTEGMHENATESERTHVTNNPDIRTGVAKYVDGVNTANPAEVASGIKDATGDGVKYSPDKAAWEGEDRIETILDDKGNEVKVKGHVGVAPGATSTETNTRITEGLIKATDTP